MRSRLFTGLAIAMVLAACGAPNSTVRGLEDSSAPSVAASVVTSPGASEPASESTSEPAPAPAPAGNHAAAKVTVGRTVGGCRVMPGANCAGADLSNADLSYLRLGGIDFSSANLSGADLSGTDLTSANLSVADLTGANFDGAILTGARLDGATLCHTWINGRTDDSTCPGSPAPTRSGTVSCTSAPTSGASEAPAVRVLGSLALVPYRRIPGGMRALDGASLSASKDTPLYALIGNTYGGDSSYFPLPRAAGDWVSMPGLPEGTPTCLTWAIATTGVFPDGDRPPDLLPGEVLFLASPMTFVADRWLAAGFGDPGFGSNVASKARAVTNPTDRAGRSDHYTGELVLFKGSTLPRGFIRADGGSLPIAEHTQLFELLGDAYADASFTTFRVPKVDAPAGYVWGIAEPGLYPSGTR